MWYYVESGYRPNTIDQTSSKKWVYLRRNIEEREREDEQTGLKILFYSYEEMKIPKENYPIYELEAQNAANLDYIAMMNDIDLDDDEGEGE